MEIYLDSADLDEIESAIDNFPIAGVTTNPTILARSGAANPAHRLYEIRQLIEDRLLFAQLTDLSFDGGFEEACKLKEYLGTPLCIKIPVTKDTLTLMTAVKSLDLQVCATACYSIPQAILAQEAGADFVAPYVSHLDNIPLDGPELACRMQKALDLKCAADEFGNGTKVLGASFRTESQVDRLIEGGAKAVTVTRQMLDEMASSFGTDKELSSFFTNWTKAYGTASIGDFID